MSSALKQIIIAVSMFGTIFTIFIVSVIRSNKQAAKDDAARFAIIKSIQFKGKVINIKTFDYGGRELYMACIKVDYSSVKSFYALNNLCFFKIKDSIATMAVGNVDKYYGTPLYVEVNINNDGMEHYFYPGGKTQTFDVSLANYGLTEADINTCN